MSKSGTQKELRKVKSPFKKNDFPKAKLFQNGRSQAVRLPKDFRFEGSEIGIGRVGNSVILFPLNDPWSIFFEGAEELAESDLGPIERNQKQSKRIFEK
jgi:antitoxin VapB